MQDVCDLLRFLLSLLYYYLYRKSIYFGKFIHFAENSCIIANFDLSLLCNNTKTGIKLSCCEAAHTIAIRS